MLVFSQGFGGPAAELELAQRRRRIADELHDYSLEAQQARLQA